MNKQQSGRADYFNKRSDDKVAYQKFARDMAAQAGLKNQSEKVDILIDSLKKSKYYDKV